MAEPRLLAPRSRPGPRAWQVPAELGFADTFARTLVDEAHGDATALAGLTLLVPSRRVAATLTDALAEAAAGRALLLPMLVPVADADLPAPVVQGAGGLPAPTEAMPGSQGEPRDMEALDRLAAAAVPSARLVEPMERLLLLAQLLAGGRGAVQALEMAGGLGRALDTLTAHGVSPGMLEDDGDGDGLAGHWEERRRVLAVVGEHWPALLAQRGLIDAVARREQLLAALAAAWQATPPAGPVLAAGFAEAPPAVRRLLAVVARLPRGGVVLPGVDDALSDTDWAGVAAGPAHPQRGLARLLSAIGATRADLVSLGPAPLPRPAARAAAVAGAMRTSSMEPPRPTAPVEGLRGFVAAQPHEEARAIALVLRAALDTPGRTAALVTPDRRLSRRVTLELARLGVQVDDSAGRPLSHTLPGRLLLLLADAMASGFTPVPLVALLGHPLLNAPDRNTAREAARSIDLALRGLAPGGGLDGVEARLARPLRGDRPAGAERETALAWWRAVARPALEPLARAPRGTLAEAAAMLLAAAQALAGDGLWRGEAGRALGDLMTRLAPGAAALPVTAGELPGVLRLLADSVPVRRPWGGGDPRITVRGLLEARLTPADVVVLGGLVDGVWPAVGQPDPWLAPGLARRLGLPTLDDRLSAQAHDLVALVSAADDAWLTASRRSEAGSVVLSRLWRRLEALGGGLVVDEAPLEAARALDGPFARARVERPQPRPPAHLRPGRLSVSDADLAHRDPFGLYARRVVRLDELALLDQPPGAADLGEAVHALLERLTGPERNDRHRDGLVAAALARLGGGPRLERLWRPRLEAMLDHVLEELAAGDWTVRLREADGAWDDDGVMLVGRADRLDEAAGGRWRIVDYKTGLVPKAGAVAGGEALQLPLLRLVVEQAGIGGLPPREVDELAYMALKGSASAPGGTRTVDCDRALARQAWAGVRALVLGDGPMAAAAAHAYARHLRGLEGFARTAEWVGRG